MKESLLLLFLFCMCATPTHAQQRMLEPGEYTDLSSLLVSIGGVNGARTPFADAYSRERTWVVKLNFIRGA